MKTHIFFAIAAVFTLEGFAQEKSEFINPSSKYGPYVWWHWAGPNFSKEGITKDLEAMKATGVGGATIFNIASAVQESHVPTENNPWPENTYRSKTYWEAIRHAAKEADRLGLEVGLHNTVGYSTTGGPWVDQESGMQCLVKTDTIVNGGQNVVISLRKGEPPIYSGWGTFKIKADRYKDIAVIAVKNCKDGYAEINDVINITEFIDNNGVLTWNAPEGEWRIFRLGYAPTMANPHPVPDDLMGKVFEVDKMSKKHNTFHWKQVLEPLKKEVGEYLGKSFGHVLIDSYEAGDQTWTENFEREFLKLKKYDPLPWLTGCVGTDEQRKRFDYDFKDVISHLYYKNGFKAGRDIIHKYGLKLQFEPYSGPFNTVTCTPLTDLPMGEFWTHSSGHIHGYVVSSARANGKTLIGAEAFTSSPENSAWTEDPAFLKYSADGAYCSGANRLILHHWVHQPFDDKYQPGLSMGWWGTHFNRHQTWFEPGKAFFDYMTRIQYMLQQGEEDVDYLCLDKTVGKCDVISSQNILDMKIRVKNNGRIVLPSGREYPFLVCPLIETVEPRVLDVLTDLSEKGAIIVGKRPVKSPSLTDYPQCDNYVKNISLKLKLCESIDEAKELSGARKSCWTSLSWDKVQVLSRTTDNGKIVFLANRTKERQNLELNVDINGKIPEIWDPETGKTYKVKNWKNTENKYTSIDMSLNENQTLFVVFKENISSENNLITSKIEQCSILDKSIKIRGGWDIDFVPKIGERFYSHFDQLSDFKYSTDKRIMYFAGKAIYKKTFNLSEDDIKSEKTVLSLGEMNDIARVYVNGKDAGVWWYPPYKKEITEFLTIGKNELIVEVYVNWANLLIGDEQIEADFEWGSDRGNRGRAIKAYPDWFLENKPRPSDRKGFVIWYYHKNDTPLQSAGLAGPVELNMFK